MIKVFKTRDEIPDNFDKKLIMFAINKQRLFHPPENSSFKDGKAITGQSKIIEFETGEIIP